MLIVPYPRPPLNYLFAVGGYLWWLCDWDGSADLFVPRDLLTLHLRHLLGHLAGVVNYAEIKGKP